MAKTNDKPQPPAKPDKAKTPNPNEMLEKIGREILSKNPHFAAVYVTSDGFAFAGESDAKNNARTLVNKEVLTVKRESKS